MLRITIESDKPNEPMLKRILDMMKFCGIKHKVMSFKGDIWYTNVVEKR